MHINDELSIKSMTVNQVYSLYVERKLKVNRQYQRKLCWTIEEKRNFIDTVSNGYPVPLFLLAIDECGVYEIIDGMQRLDALCTFIEQKYELRDGYFNLESMPDTLQLKRKGVLKQGRQILSIEKCKDIANYPLPISVFPARDSSIEEVFKRIKFYRKTSIVTGVTTDRCADRICNVSEATFFGNEGGLFGGYLIVE